MDKKQDAALSPLHVRMHDDMARVFVCAESPTTWTWNAAELRAASKALAALADQLDEPRRNAGPLCTFTREEDRLQVGYRGATIGILCRACGIVGTMTSTAVPETPGPCQCGSAATVYVTPPRG